MNTTSPPPNADRLDQRDTRYRFDLDADVPWAQVRGEGVFHGASWRARFGASEAAFGGEAGDELQWALALATCRAFIALETDILEFVARDRVGVPRRSVDLLVEEEAKHVALFERWQERLRAAHPDRTAAFDAVWRRPVAWADVRAVGATDVERQATFWLTTLFFEEYTVYLDDALRLDRAGVDAAWLATHRCHRREEAQHVLTDASELAALELPPEVARRAGVAFRLFLEANFDRFFGLDVVRDYAARRRLPDPFPGARRLRDLPFFRDLEAHPAFRRTRAAIPGLAPDAAPVPPRVATPPAGPAGTLTEALMRAACDPERGVRLVEVGGDERRWTYGALVDRARRRLGGLRDVGHARGAPIVAVASRPMEVLPTFWAGVFGGNPVAVVAPPDPRRPADVARVLAAIDAVPGARVVADAAVARALAASRPSLPITELAQLDAASQVDPGRARPDDVALLQLSSGSTAAPRPIRLTHQNLLANALGMIARRGTSRDDVFVSWLPLFHDMGLIGFHVTPLVDEAEQVLLDPASFLTNPLTWVRRLSAHRATVTGGPSSAILRLLPRLRPEVVAEIDLTALGTWLIGAEPVAIGPLRRLVDALAPAGLDPGALCPGYGLAEASLAVTMGHPGDGARGWSVSRASLADGAPVDGEGAGAVALVDCGAPIPGVEVRVTDDAGAPVPDGRVGRIEVRGPTVTPDVADWLDTGDQGVFTDGRLFVTGRREEVFFDGGRTCYTFDVEAVAAAVPGVRPDGVALIVHPPDEDGVEERVLCVATAPGADPVAVASAVRAAVAAQTGLALDDVVFVRRSDIPRTTSGKIRRFALGEALRRGDVGARVSVAAPSAVTAAVAALNADIAGSEARRSVAVAGGPTPTRVKVPSSRPLFDRAAGGTRDRVRAIWAAVLGRDPASIPDDAPFAALGGRSILAADVHARVEQAFGRSFGLDLLESGDTVAAMARFLDGEVAPAPRPAPTASPRVGSDAVAVVALAVRFPGADDVPAWAERLFRGEASIGRAPASRGVDLGPGSFFDDVAGFDPEPFGLSDAEARAMDPQQRLFLEVALDALGQSALPTRKIGVYAASGDVEYAMGFGADPGPFALLGSLKNVVAARVSERFGLQGPALVVDSACSSSLLAVHLAMRALREGACDAALVGGVQLMLTDRVARSFGAAGLLAPDGVCRPFDQRGGGLVPGEGAVAVVLRPLADAVRDGDRIWGVLRGSAVTNDAGAVSGTAPNPRGQRDAIAAAWADAGIDPSTAAYVEAHAAGTAIGDAVEASALAAVFQGAERVVLGSVKGSVGHTFAVSGIAGLAQALVALDAERIPPIAGLEQLTERARWSDGPLAPARRVTPWPRGDRSRRAGVDSFGLGGTNVHVVVEEAPPLESRTNAQNSTAPRSAGDDGSAAPPSPAPTEQDPVVAVPLAGPPGSLPRVAASWVGGEGTLSARAAGAARRASWGAERRAVVAGTVAELDRALAAVEGGVRPGRLRIAWLLPGPGSQRAQMGEALSRQEPAFREGFERCRQAFADRGLPLRDLTSDAAIDRIDVAQAAVFSFSVATAAWLSDLGVAADAVVGHSAGELAAAHLSGALSFDDAVTAVLARGRALRSAPAGGMVAALAERERVVAAVVGLPCDVAAENAPLQTVLSAPSDALPAVVAALSAAGIDHRALRVTTPAHSRWLAPVLPTFLADLAGVRLEAPRLPWFSSGTGGRLGTPDAEFWASQLIGPVRFAGAARAAYDAGFDTFVDLAAGAGLGSCVEAALGAAVVRVGSKDQDEVRTAIAAVASLWERGAPVRLDRQGGARARPASLPVHPWRRRRLWHEEPGSTSAERLFLDGSLAQDHRVGGVATAPASQLVDALLGRFGGGLSRLVLRAPIPVPSGGVSLDLRRDGDDVAVALGGEVVASATLGPAPGRLFATLDLAAARARCSAPRPPDEVYRRRAATGFEIGPSLRAIEAVAVGDGELVVDLVTPPGSFAGARVDPALLDAATQAAAAWAADDRRWVGFSVGSVAVHADVRGRAVAVVRLRHQGPDVVRFDVWWCDPGGALLAELSDFTARPAPSGDGPVVARAASAAATADPRRRSGVGGLTAGRSAPRAAAETIVGGSAADAAFGSATRVLPAPTVAPWAAPAGSGAASGSAEPAGASSGGAAGALLDVVRPLVAARLRRPPERIGLDDALVPLGLDSMKAVALAGDLERALGAPLPVTILFEARTLRDLLAVLSSLVPR
jgi:acyl transferase domain-containing protein/acyl-CoA synthetase (AMP-forming)/AMP-acid ligase II/acyl carrier protein